VIWAWREKMKTKKHKNLLEEKKLENKKITVLR
jgi:hypothetical protein